MLPLEVIQKIWSQVKEEFLEKPSITVILTALKPATMSKQVSTTKLNYFEVKFFTCTTDTTRTSDHPSEPPAAQKENHQHP